MKVLVIGGTLFLGKALVELLLKEGHHVTVFTRGNLRPHFWNDTDHIIGDRTQSEDFHRVLKGKSFDVVIDNIAYNAEQVETALEVFNGNIGRYMLTSSGWVYVSGTFTLPLSEEDVDHNAESISRSMRGVPDNYDLNRYPLGKVRAERVLMEQDDIRYTIIRPAQVLGPEDRSIRGYFYFQRLMDGQPIILTDGGVQSHQVSYSRDLARSYLLAMDNVRAENQAYNITQREIFRVVDWLHEAAQLLGVVPQFVNVPADVLDSSYPTYNEGVFLATYVTDLSKAIEELGYTTTPQSIWLGETVRWYRDSYKGPDSPGYDGRQKEIDFARQYQATISHLAS